MKLMCLGYKHIISIHACSGASGGSSCPFYEELHQNFGKCASISDKRVAHSLKIVLEMSPLIVHHIPPVEGSTGLFTSDLETINAMDIYAPVPSTSDKFRHYEQAALAFNCMKVIFPSVLMGNPEALCAMLCYATT